MRPADLQLVFFFSVLFLGMVMATFAVWNFGRLDRASVTRSGLIFLYTARHDLERSV
jgi:hypothetical protein